MTEQSPTVTVVIPTYNSSGTLRLSLETVLWQDFVDFEVWVVGDGCTDDSETIVSSFGDTRVHWVNLPANSGTPSMPRNEALRHARGRLIAYLGHDDLWFPWHLSELVDCIEKSNCDLAFSLGVMLGPEGVVGAFTLPKTARGGRTAISPSNWLHRKNLIEVVGPWSTTIRIGERLIRSFLSELHELFDQAVVQHTSVPAVNGRISLAVDSLDALQPLALPQEIIAPVAGNVRNNVLPLVFYFSPKIIHPISANDKKKMGRVVFVEFDITLHVPITEDKNSKAVQLIGLTLFDPVQHILLINAQGRSRVPVCTQRMEIDPVRS
ncbi:unnamed protein product [marine sediment metagenome]|uniref:Glycosyltransferase 2-like domain-containing protein n=1 Tax=marine sediment metagenome TaxID=412755 RepID=X0Z9Z7_9ZZZZ